MKPSVSIIEPDLINPASFSLYNRRGDFYTELGGSKDHKAEMRRLMGPTSHLPTVKPHPGPVSTAKTTSRRPQPRRANPKH